MITRTKELIIKPLTQDQIEELKDKIINPLTVIVAIADKPNNKDLILKQVDRIINYLNELEKQSIR